MSLVPLSGKELDRVFRQPLPKYFTQPEVNAILSAVAHDPRSYVLINALWKTGARISELLDLRREDLDPYAKSIRLKTLKHGVRREIYRGVGRKSRGERKARFAERMLIVPDDLMVGVMSWLYAKKDGEDGKIFGFSRVTAFRIVKEACSLAGIKDSRAHPHTFRHSYAVHLLRQGVPVTVLKDLLGHSNISSTLVYLRITQPDAKAMLAMVQW